MRPKKPRPIEAEIERLLNRLPAGDRKRLMRRLLARVEAVHSPNPPHRAPILSPESISAAQDI
jgi:hypothetical protein